jgi:hypothetical protein
MKSNLPEKDFLSKKYPKDEFLGCFFDAFFDSAFTIDEVKNNIKGMKKYSFSVLSFDDDTPEKSYYVTSNVIKGYPTPISQKELAKYNIKSFNVIKKHCFVNSKLKNLYRVYL